MTPTIHTAEGWRNYLSVIQQFCTEDEIRLTKHAAYRLEERGIKYAHVIAGIMNGEIIEDYPTDAPNPSVLLLGNADNNPLHIVVGVGAENIQIITAYHPSDKKWENNFKTRKAVQ